MPAYMKQIANEIAAHLDPHELGEGLPARYQTLLAELDRLDPRDFQPDQRFPFVETRRRLHCYAGLDASDWKRIARLATQDDQEGSFFLPIVARLELTEAVGHYFPKSLWMLGTAILDNAKALLATLSKALDAYLGPEMRTQSRAFAFMKDENLKKIVERDYRELMQKLLPMESWKSVVILAGSILEALLHDLLTRDEDRVVAAMAASRAPKRSKSAPRDLRSDDYEDQWTLDNYIKVSHDLGLLPGGWEGGVHAALREFRNYVHPRRELKADERITQGAAMQAAAMLLRVCEHLEATPT